MWGTIWGQGIRGGATGVSLPTQPWEACWASRSGPLPSRVPSGCVGHRDIGGREGGEEEEMPTRRGPPGSQDRGGGGTRLVFPPPTWAQ